MAVCPQCLTGCAIRLAGTMPEPFGNPVDIRIEGCQTKIKGLSQKLPEAELALLKAWVDSGAPWPSERVLDLYETTTDVRAGRDWWSLQPVERPVAPRLAKQPIDAVILAKLKRISAI